MIRTTVQDRRVVALGLLLSVIAVLAFSGAPRDWVIAAHIAMAIAAALNVGQVKPLRGSRLLAVGAMLWALTQALRIVVEAPLLAVIAPALVGVALAVAGQAHAEFTNLKGHLVWVAMDIGVLLIALFTVQWFLLLEPYFTTDEGLAPQPALVFVSIFAIFPVAVSMAYLIHLGHHRTARWLHVLGALCLGIFASAWAHGVQSPLIEILAGIGLFSVVTATLDFHQRAPKVFVRDEELSLAWPSPIQLLPTLVGAIALGIVLSHVDIGRWNDFDLVLAVVVSISIVLRQILYFIEERRLFLVVVDQQKKLRHQAMHDPLTSLANRDLFYDRLYHAVQLRQRTPAPISLIYLDIDDFKEINRRYGHGTADSVLVALADRLSTWVRPTDTVARLGADEFAVLVDGSQETAMMVSSRLAEEISRGFELSGRLVPVRASIGIASTNDLFEDVTESVTELINRADRAMHDAKRERGHSTVVRADR